VGELVPAARVGNENLESRYNWRWWMLCLYCILEMLQRSSTGRVCGWRLYNGVLNDANGGLSLLNDDTQSQRSDRSAICSSSLMFAWSLLRP
jgi:hypothetical protein